MNKTKLLILLPVLLLISSTLAFQTNSTSYKLTSTLAINTQNSTSNNFTIKGILGQTATGTNTSTSYKLIHGILGPASFIITTPPPAGAAGGGAGCAQGYYKASNGDCLPITTQTQTNQTIPTTNQTLLEQFLQLGTRTYPQNPTIGWAFITALTLTTYLTLKITRKKIIKKYTQPKKQKTTKQ